MLDGALENVEIGDSIISMFVKNRKVAHSGRMIWTNFAFCAYLEARVGDR